MLFLLICFGGRVGVTTYNGWRTQCIQENEKETLKYMSKSSMANVLFSFICFGGMVGVTNYLRFISYYLDLILFAGTFIYVSCSP